MATLLRPLHASGLIRARAVPDAWIVGGDRASVEGVFSGTHDGVLQSPGGEVPPSGKPVTFQWTASYVVRGNQLASEHLYFDQLRFLGQLGPLPE